MSKLLRSTAIAFRLLLWQRKKIHGDTKLFGDSRLYNKKGFILLNLSILILYYINGRQIFFGIV